ncbi:MAG: hypothetical protein K9G08_00745 [Pontimonas sp.]|nr:hypothetical protein [Pontimonas sp.]MCF8547573.1 hypothetical protein [Pontimonas sp.]
MPTSRPRHMITETDALSAALERAAELWPEDARDRGRLLRRVLSAGIESVETAQSNRLATRRSAIEQAAGSLTGVWPADWRSSARDEWPA